MRLMERRIHGRKQVEKGNFPLFKGGKSLYGKAFAGMGVRYWVLVPGT
jgi:hypothetical protein